MNGRSPASEKLISSYAKAPDDATALLALADSLLEDGGELAPALLRCAWQLCKVGWPDETDESLTGYVHGDVTHPFPLQLPHSMWAKPRYNGIENVGRLPGIVAAMRCVNRAEAAENRVWLLSYLAACLLYACRVFGPREKVRYFPESGNGYCWRVEEIYMKAGKGFLLDNPWAFGRRSLPLLRLQGGSAGQALSVMKTCESVHVRCAWRDDGKPLYTAWKREHKRRHLALARTYHLALMDCLRDHAPWDLARQDYLENLKAKRLAYEDRQTPKWKMIVPDQHTKRLL